MGVFHTFRLFDLTSHLNIPEDLQHRTEMKIKASSNRIYTYEYLTADVSYVVGIGGDAYAMRNLFAPS